MNFIHVQIHCNMLSCEVRLKHCALYFKSLSATVLTEEYDE